MQPDYPLLGLLARRPASGYDLGKWLRSDGRFLGRKGSMSPIYRALGELQRRGWVETTTETSTSGPDANVHSLTPEGREALVAWAKSEHVPSPRPMDVDFMVKLNFAGQLGPEHAARIVHTELEYRRAQRAEELAETPAPREAAPIPEIDPEWLEEITGLTADRGWQNTSLLIGWLETTERQLQSIIRRRGAAGEPNPGKEA